MAGDCDLIFKSKNSASAKPQRKLDQLGFNKVTSPGTTTSIWSPGGEAWGLLQTETKGTRSPVRSPNPRFQVAIEAATISKLKLELAACRTRFEYV